MTTALITGATGFVGPYLSQHLSSSGDDVVAVSTTTGGPDLLDADGWRDVIGSHKPDVVYHLGGWSDVGGSWSNPKTTFTVNALGTQSVLEAVRVTRCPCRVVLVSSADVYGTTDPDRLPITESFPVRPNSPYGVSKVAAEELARQYYRGWGIETVIARPFNHIGPGQSERFAAPSFAHRIAECELSGGGVVSHGNLSARRDFTDVRDVVRAYRLLGTRGVPGVTYNICSGKDVQIGALLEKLVSMAGVPIQTELDQALVRPVELAVMRGSFDLLASATGWSPTIGIDETLIDILAEARKHATGANQ